MLNVHQKEDHVCNSEQAVASEVTSIQEEIIYVRAVAQDHKTRLHKKNEFLLELLLKDQKTSLDQKQAFASKSKSHNLFVRRFIVLILKTKLRL